MNDNKQHVAVVGAGIGGVCTAAYLLSAGYRVTLLEKTKYPGGRCSDRERDGCRVTTGALMIPMGPSSAIRQAFDSLGVDMDMVDVTGRMRYRLDHGDYDLPPQGGGLAGMVKFAMQDEAEATRFLGHIKRALYDWTPLDNISVREWFDQYTDNQPVKQLFDGYCAALMGVRMHEISAYDFFLFLKHSSKGTRFGLARKGNRSLIEDLLSAFVRQGGEVRYQVSCRSIRVEDDRVTGLVVSNESGEQELIESDIVVSNLGPDATVSLCGGESLFEKSYVQKLHEHAEPVPIYHVSFVMDRPLVPDFEGCMVFGNNRNLIYLEIPSAISPGTLSPEGRYLHTAYGAPENFVTADLDEELARTVDELERNFPGFKQDAEILVKAKFSAGYPAGRRAVGRSLPVNTPITGLYMVGDGNAERGKIGTESAAASGRLASQMITSRFPLH